MPDWHLDDLLRATGGKRVNPVAAPVHGFSIDTRTIAPGEVFVAFPGERLDGHDFIPQAVQKGAAAVIASRFPAEALASASTACIQVEDPLKALQDLARFHRSRHAGTFLGVTGSNGKTTTKEMLRHVFAATANTWATAGNLNNHIGLPLNLVRLPLATRIAIIEMGMNHPGEIRFLASVARPQSAVITNVGPAHIGILGSLENIALAKAEILEGLGRDGTGVVEGDSPYLPLFRRTCPGRLVTFGFGPDCDVRGNGLQIVPDGVRFQVTWMGQEEGIRLPLLGKHNAMNALAALAMFVSLGNPLSAGTTALSTFQPVGARMESHLVDGSRIILDCYNANPASMLQAVEFLRICPGKRIAVLGDMRELGEESPDFHAQIGLAVARAGLEVLVTVGEQAQHIAEGARRGGMSAGAIHACGDTGEAVHLMQGLLQEKATILLKASRGMHFESIARAVWPQLPCDLH